MKPLYEKKLTHNQITFRYSKGKSHLEGNEIHPYHEILYYMDGDVTFLSEEFQEELTPNTLLIIPRAYYHQFLIGDQNNYTRLVLNFPDVDDTLGLLTDLMTGIRILKQPNDHLYSILQRMCQVLNSDKPDRERSVLLYGAFLMLFAELNMDQVQITSPHPREHDRLITRCIQYIDQNFTSEISAEILAKEMNVSVSTLFHCFKKELGISMYKYIIEKRLIHAHRLIMENQKPTKIFMECGYHDYPTFYKAYLKMFGQPPSAR